MTFEQINGFNYLVDEKGGDLINLSSILCQIFEKPLAGQIHSNIFIHNRDQLFMDPTKTRPDAYVRLTEFRSVVEPCVPPGQLKMFKMFMNANGEKMLNPRKFLAPQFRIESDRYAGYFINSLDKLKVVCASDEEKKEIQDLIEHIVAFTEKTQERNKD